MMQKTAAIASMFSREPRSMRSRIDALGQGKEVRLTAVTPLIAEIRSRLAHVAAHPSTIEVKARDGLVVLSGPVFDHELKRLLETVSSVPGVKEVRHEFDVITSTRDIQAEHRPENTFGYQAKFIVGRWAPWLRLAAGISGLLLLGQGFRKRGALGVLSSGVGIALTARAITNRDVTHLLGSFILPVLRMRRSLHVAASVEDVYEFWSHFSNYPKFMSFIRDVNANDIGGLRWEGVAPGGTHVSWETTVVELTPNQKISWKSVPGSLIATEGIVHMEPTEFQGTKMHIELSYAPPVGALGYAAAHFLGFDPRSRIDEDLEVMRILIEKQARKSGSIPREDRGEEDYGG